MIDKPGGMPAPTRSLGQYEIIREIGRGGMATVYLARQLALERNVALKELSAFHAGSADLAQRFLRESRLAGSLNHPSVVTVHEYFEYSGTPYIAMEYIPRGSLRPYVGRLDLAAFAGVMEGILAGLAHAEAFGIVHRDLKPENIMVTNEGRVKVADFGIAKATMTTGAGGFKTATGMTVGTPAYMAPEQIMGEAVGIWTDLYSLGVMAYEHAVGNVPFHDSEVAAAVLMRHVTEPIPSPRDINPDIDPDLSSWIERLLIKEPGKRTQSPTTAWDELEEIVLRLQGPRWRRAARLPENAATLDPPRPLTPAPFESHRFEAAAQAPPLLATPTEIDTPEIEDVQGAKALRVAPTQPSAGRRARRAIADTTPSRGRGGAPVAAETTTPSAARKPRVGAVVATVGLVAAVVIAGFLIGRSGHRTRIQRPPTRSAATGPVVVSLPAAWISPAAAPSIPGLEMTAPIVREDPVSGGLFVAGVVTGAGGHLLVSPSFLSRLSGAPAANDPVRLGGAVAYRYRDLSVRGLSTPLTLFVSPTSAGVVGIGCVSPKRGSAAFEVACEQAAGTLRLGGAHALALGPDAAYARALADAVAKLRSADPAMRTLARAKTSAEQARLCASLGREQAAAGAGLAAAHPGPDAAALNGRLISALRDAAAAYQRMSQGAATRNGIEYASARTQVARALQGEHDALAALRQLGY